MLKTIALALLALFPLTAALRAADLSTAETTQLLGRLQEHRAKYPSLTAEFTEERTSHLLNKPIVSQGTLAFQAPNKFKRELRGNNASIMVSNGQVLWMDYPNFKTAERYTLGTRAFLDDAIEALIAGLNFQNVSEYYHCAASQEPDGYRLVLTPKSSGVKRMVQQITVFMDNEFKIVKTVTVLPKGDEVVTSYRNQRAVAVPASTFEYTPPADTAVTQPLGK